MAKLKKAKRVRLNIRIPETLVDWAKRHAREKNTSVTQIIVSHFTTLKEAADGK